MAFEDRRAGTYQVHNMLLLSWYCAGILGFIGSVGILGVPFLQFHNHRNNMILKRDKEMVYFSFAAFFGMCMIVMASPNLYVLTTFFPLLVWNAVNRTFIKERLAIINRPEY